MDRRAFSKGILGLLSLWGAKHSSPANLFAADLHRLASAQFEGADSDSYVKDHLIKTIDFDKDFADDAILPPEKMVPLKSVIGKLSQLQSYVGHGHFNLMSWDDMNRYLKRGARLTPLKKKEVHFLEEIFYTVPKSYGFYGKKVIQDINYSYSHAETVKVPGSGHYLFQGAPLKIFQQIRREVGESLILTSGIRSVVKQMYLFLIKADSCKGNLSRASRSLAPPGHSYHGVGDFDVGKKNWGARNFTNDFAGTDEFKKLMKLGHISIRYTPTNPFGVRYEPWHIKVERKS